MSYDIYIGEAEIDIPNDPDREEGYDLTVRVSGMSHPEAPSFPGDGMTGNGNSRHPGYSAWADFTERHGLGRLFFDSSAGLMREHPGCALLTKGAHERIVFALEAYRAKNPDKVPGWDPNLTGVAAWTGQGADPKYDGDLARLIWLEWWVRWALANCKVPALYNH